MNILMSLLVNGLAVFVTSYILPGVKVESFTTALIVGVVLGVLNTFLRPVLILLTLPINILTLGLFTLVLNGFLIMLVSSLVRGFSVRGFGSAVLFSLVLTLVSWFLNSLKSS